MSRTGEVIGALLFGHAAPSVFDERSERVVRSVAAQAAVAIENARLLEAEQWPARQAEQTTARLALLQEVTARLARTLTTEEAVDAVMETLVSRLGAAPGRGLPAHARGRPAGRGRPPRRVGIGAAVPRPAAWES